MAIKVSTIELKDVEVVELEDGSYDSRFVNPRKYPAFLTNRALKKGRNMGVTKSSLISDLIQMNSLFKSNQKGKENPEIDLESLTPEQAEIIEAENYLPVIYLGLLGANKNLDLDYDDFLDQYQGDLSQIIQDYMELVMPYIDQNSNEFKKEFENKTKKK